MQLARRGGAVLAGIVIVLSALAILTGATSRAHPPDPPSPPDPPPDSALIRPLAPITPTPSNWAPKFPFPYDQTRGNITDADISAQRELCQWYNAQYVTLRDQIDRLQFNRIAPNGTDYDYSLYGLQEQVDIVTGNIDQSLAFMEPRVRAFTQSRNHFGDVYFPLYEAEAFYKLWEQLSNVTDGIKAHQPNWFTGPSVQKAKRWGSDIHRSHVCDGA
ncbi:MULTISPECIES: hypothetical protein [unclassified Mycobacterium]|uniref:hypothetical protein n=1 Tax=unclassified Mycobacterium TaxID=2642494 RepID=UPI00073FEB54|nr:MULTISPECIES: hypothetical protein [unclassified Mycobacterium]KUH85961.1 hypothetical protein AU185_11580 [Mycobacterium sp. GA-0227b]KUH85977.1 hypothetical protein AU186_11060 [Mycobacterium sp. GA-1999]KUH87769.1 hypothetical protein AU187_04365 [Mycobacterium sp. IS-1556]